MNGEGGWRVPVWVIWWAVAIAGLCIATSTSGHLSIRVAALYLFSLGYFFR